MLSDGSFAGVVVLLDSGGKVEKKDTGRAKDKGKAREDDSAGECRNGTCNANGSPC